MSKPVRVVFCLNDFLVGGAQRQLSEQLRHFDRQRFDITLVTLFTFENKETLYASLPSDLPMRQLAFKGWWDVVAWFRLRRTLQRLQPDVVVSSFFFANTVCRILKPFVGYISIARVHNTYTHKPIYQQWLDRLLAQLSYKIVAVSKTVADFTAAQERIALSKFVVIQNGIDATAVEKKLDILPTKEALRTQHSFAVSDLLFVNVARLTPQKNHELLITGFAAFSKKHTHCKLVIVGEGALRSALEAQARALGAEGNIRFVGHQIDPWPWYKLADVFVSTSRIEGLSNAYLEALAADLPLIATNTAGTDELLTEGENGFFIKENEEKTVVESLEKVLHADIEQLKQGARARARDFDVRTTVKKYENLFTSAYLGAER